MKNAHNNKILCNEIYNSNKEMENNFIIKGLVE